jgi:ribosomal protein S18 acetylase RimI-like enzyme
LGLRIIPFACAHETACAELLCGAWPEMFPAHPPAAAADFSILTEGETVFVALGGTAVAGFVSVWPPDAFIHLLIVDARHRRQGIGQALLDHATEHLGGPADLKCGLLNIAAQQFYRRRGWLEIETVDNAHASYIRFRLPPSH